MVGAVFWGLSAFATVGWLASWLLREGSGHEIILEGDELPEAKDDEPSRV